MRLLLAIVALGLLTTHASGQRQPPQVALTFDDLPATGQAPLDASRVEIVGSILRTLTREHMPPVYGFVNATQIQNAPQLTNQVLTDWRAAGNLLGNHTWSHPDLESLAPEQFEADILRNEPTLRQYAGPTDWHWFRYPFLHEGETLAKRQQIQTFLKEHGYRIAEVSLDFEDYIYNAPYSRCVDKGRAGAVTALHDSYLALADGYTDIFRSLTHTLYGRDIPYVLLLHVGAATASFLPDLIEQLRARGFTFITLPEAMHDPAYAMDPAIGYPGGGALQETLTAARKLPFPPNAKPYAQLEHMCQQ